MKTLKKVQERNLPPKIVLVQPTTSVAAWPIEPSVPGSLFATQATIWPGLVQIQVLEVFPHLHHMPTIVQEGNVSIQQ